ncbi:ABC transporter substrate-binding protein [Denitromonas iodatirespirans]|uniref:ABC transporter substrate-binding protein n=1 Tax=Denitromonas iodatirespirans TaxID=2795389 RepID=A0A944H802_DENI1|nr:hypothetical protein [Denitromonas iodatirespirans]MBT0961778.1 ABC transporter substrate-binding protein [Denitromonas iodatirespirans]
MRFVLRMIAVSLSAMAGVQAAECPRVVSQSPYLTIAIDWLGQAECIVGVSRDDSFKPALPRTGTPTAPDAKAIAALKPELVIGSASADAAVFAAAVPAGAQAVQLGGFTSMLELEGMLEDLARLVQSPEGGKVSGFRRGWFTRAKNTGARGERALLLTTCGGTPTVYGRRHVLGDLFHAAGFNVLEAEVGTRAEADVAGLIARSRPDIVFTIDRPGQSACTPVPAVKDVRIIPLDGEHFLYPGPRMLDGIEDLTRIMRTLKMP